MKKLYIVRHAKSSWEIGQDDFERGLKKKGKLNAPFMAGKLLSRGVNVEQIISSSAKRTIKTTALLNQVLGVPKAMVSYNKDLYLAAPKEIIKQIQQTNDSINELMIVAHNPGVTQVVNFLAKEHFENIPTSGMACILFDIESWSELKNNGKLGFFIYPKMFKQSLIL
jgi:phosphohistidine phosphatase